MTGQYISGIWNPSPPVRDRPLGLLECRETTKRGSVELVLLGNAGWRLRAGRHQDNPGLKSEFRHTSTLLPGDPDRYFPGFGVDRQANPATAPQDIGSARARGNTSRPLRPGVRQSLRPPTEELGSRAGLGAAIAQSLHNVVEDFSLRCEYAGCSPIYVHGFNEELLYRELVRFLKDVLQYDSCQFDPVRALITPREFISSSSSLTLVMC